VLRGEGARGGEYGIKGGMGRASGRELQLERGVGRKKAKGEVEGEGRERWKIGKGIGGETAGRVERRRGVHEGEEGGRAKGSA